MGENTYRERSTLYLLKCQQPQALHAVKVSALTQEIDCFLTKQQYLQGVYLTLKTTKSRTL